MAHVSTSSVQRRNPTLWTHMRRFTRLTDALSKRPENDAHMAALYAVWYSFVRTHKSLRVSTAMAAEVSGTLWSWEEIAERVDAHHAKPVAKRGAYRKREKVEG